MIHEVRKYLQIREKSMSRLSVEHTPETEQV